MKEFKISQCALDKLYDTLYTYGAIELINDLVKAHEERTRIIASIQYGVGNIQREEDEDPRLVLKELRECYSADTEQEANDRAWLLRNLCELIEGANEVDSQYRRACLK